MKVHPLAFTAGAVVVGVASLFIPSVGLESPLPLIIAPFSVADASRGVQ